MASENETVADIVKEKRDTADEMELKGKNTFAFDLAKMLREEADRIEAAHQREVAELAKVEDVNDVYQLKLVKRPNQCQSIDSIVKCRAIAEEGAK